MLKKLLVVAVLVVLGGCDAQRISELEEGVATESDVRARFGEPEAIWEGDGGARVLEYNRQPAGLQNYMITIGADGRMSALRQVLTPANFSRVQPGMTMAQVRRMLGKPARVVPYPRQRETHHEWRYLEPPNTVMVFAAVFGPEDRVLRTDIRTDPDAGAHGGGR